MPSFVDETIVATDCGDPASAIVRSTAETAPPPSLDAWSVDHWMACFVTQSQSSEGLDGVEDTLSRNVPKTLALGLAVDMQLTFVRARRYKCRPPTSKCNRASVLLRRCLDRESAVGDQETLAQPVGEAIDMEHGGLFARRARACKIEEATLRSGLLGVQNGRGPIEEPGRARANERSDNEQPELRDRSGI